MSNKLPFKITNVKRSRRVGLVVSDLEDLKQRAGKLLQLNCRPDDACVRLEDGTEVCDDAFLTSLKPHSLLIVDESLNFLPGAPSLVDAVEKYFAAVDVLRQFPRRDVESFLGGKRGQFLLNNALKWMEGLPKTKSTLSLRNEHPEWFVGCNKLVNSKEEYFRKCAQGRIRSYLRDAKSKLSESVVRTKILDFFQQRLDSHHFYACYFDRKDPCDDRLCDNDGRFCCQGKHDQKSCKEDHSINPYDNSESRILFTTWNLDHVVERKVILPSLETQLNARCGSRCYSKYFNLLFTLRNLKLVHKNCHVIGSHLYDCVIQHEH